RISAVDAQRYRGGEVRDREFPARSPDMGCGSLAIDRGHDVGGADIAITLLERCREHRIARVGIDEGSAVGNLLLVLQLRAVYGGATAARIEQIDWRKPARIVFRQFDRPAEVGEREIGRAAIKI